MRISKWLFGVCLMVLAICGGSIKASAAFDANGWEYEERYGLVYVVGYYGTDETVTVPAEIDGKEIYEISSFNGTGRDTVRHVTVSEGIVEIGWNAFEYCSELESVTLPEGLLWIGLEAFLDCGNLKNIDIPSTVTSIGRDAFSGTAISEIYIPGAVENLSSRAFEGCRNLINITVDSENANYASVNGSLYNKSVTELLRYPQGKDCVEIPDSVNTLTDIAFEGCNNITSVIIPESVKSIGKWCFHGCSNLRSIEIKEGCMRIGVEAFSRCPLLESVIIPDSVVEFVRDESSVSEEGGSIVGYSPLATIYANPGSRAKAYVDSWMYWEKNLKFSCIQHENIVTESVPSTCSKQGERYTCCKACNRKNIDENGNYVRPTVLPKVAHQYDGGVVTTAPSVLKTGTRLYKCKACGAVKSEAIAKMAAPGKGKSLSDSGHFYKVTKSGIKNGTVEYTGTSGAKGSVVIPDTVMVNDVTYKVTSVGKGAFKNNKKMTKVTIGKNVTKINADAFSGCKSLKTITVKSKNINSVGKNAFKGIKSNAKIKVPSNRLKTYRKTFKNKGQKFTVKIVK